MVAWLDRFEALKSQAEDLASEAQQEVDSRRGNGSSGSQGGAQNLNARRKVMEMGRVITSMDKLANESMYAATLLRFPLHAVLQCVVPRHHLCQWVTEHRARCVILPHADVHANSSVCSRHTRCLQQSNALLL